MEITKIYTPVALKGNSYRSVKNNNLVTVVEVGPSVSQIKVQSEMTLKPEYIQIDTAELVNGILFNKLIFQGHENDQEEMEVISRQCGTRITFEPGHRYIKVGARNAVIKGGLEVKHLPDSEAKATRPYKRININTIQTEARAFNTLRIKSDINDDIYVTVDSEFEGLQFTAVKTGLVMEITEVMKTHVSCKVGIVNDDHDMIDVRFERDFEMYDFIKGIQDGRIKPEPAFYDMIEEQRRQIEIFDECFELHCNYFDSSEEPKDFGTDESARASDFQWVNPKPKKNRISQPKMHSIQERMKFKSKAMTHEQLIAWANEAFND